jgi:hypothetical protein
VDELSVYNRGLSAAEVQTIYNAGSAGKCFTPVPPAITQQPTNQSVVAGTTVALSVTATGTQLLSYQWQFNNTNLNGATNPLFTLSPVNASEAGAYRVVVSNAFGFAVSSNAVLTVNPAICTAPPAGLVSWWRAEGDATDSGGTNDGTLSGSVTYAPEEVGQGFVFDGNGSYIQLGNPASLQLQDFTIETWLARRSTSVTSLDGNGLGFILAYGNSGYGLFLDAGGVPGLTKLGISSVQPTMAITDTNLHHVAVTKSGSNVVFYVDGAGYPAPAFNPGFVFDSSATIGGISNSYSFYGLVDELSVYNRGLSATEISSIYDAGSAGKCFTPIQPAITQQPTNQTVTAGITAIMNVTAAGTRPLTYQWSFGTNSMPGATNGSLVLPKVQATNAGIYSVVVSNPYGSATSSNAVLTVNNAPVCDPPPSGLVSWWRAEGNAVDAIGTNDGALSGNVAYAPGEVGQGFLFDGAGSYVQLGNPAGLQLQNFTIETWVARSSVSAATGDGNGHAFFMSYGNSGYGFYMLNDGSLGLTKVGISEVQPTVTITDTNLHHVAVTKSGTSVVFYVDGVGYPAPAYDPGFVFDSSATIGGIGNNYSFYGLVDELSVYNRGLSAAEVQSIYNASSAGKCFLPLPPTITQQPTNQTVAVGTTATLGVTVTGTRPLSYQWTLGGLTLPGATNASLILSNVQTTNAGTYAVIVTNIAASVTSSNAVLTVNVPVCDTPPSGLVSWWRAEGNAFDSAGTNNGTVNGNVTYAPEEVGQGFVFDGSGSYVQLGNPASLQLQDFTIETWLARRSSTVTSLDGNGLGLILTYDSNGGYGLFMDASGRPGLTEVGISSVQPTVAITDTNLHHVAVTKSGASVVFYVDGAAYPAPAFNPGFVFNSSATIGGIGNNYSFYGLVDELSVYNRGLSAAEVAAIYNAGSAGKCTPPVAPSITQQPTNQTVVAGTVATLSVTATGTQPLSYQWFFGTNGLAGATNGSLVLTNVQAANAGTYAVTITNIAGGVTSSNAVITVVFVPSIKRQPAPLQLMILGCTATFSATVSGTPPLIYQWLKNGSALNNQTNLSFVLSNVQSSDFATYNLAVTNGYGFAVSSNAVLAPDHLPVANPVTVQRFPGGGLRVDTATVTGADTDADGDELSIIGVSSSSAAGGAVNWTGSSIYYTPPAGYTNADTFGYVVSDGHCGGTAAGFVTVQIKTDTTPYASVTIRQSADGSIQVTFDGEPGYRYRVQKTDGLINPVWQDVTSLTADEFGTFQYVDTPPTNAPTRYYRCVWP